MHSTVSNVKPAFDQVIQSITHYVSNYQVTSAEAVETAYHMLLDSIACGLMALHYPACTRLLGPIVPGATLLNGARVFGTHYCLEPVHAAFNIGAMIRWLDFNDTWLAAEWGHPSDNLGAILAVADYLTRNDPSKKMSVNDVLIAAIKAHEIQGVLALANSFNRVGLDHVILVKIASAAVATHLLGGDEQQINNAISLAWVDGHSLRTYRHAPNTGTRKSWAAGDATSRAVRLALMARQGEMGYPSALSAPQWGFYDSLFASKQFVIEQEFGSYVMENILFKISFPAEFHAQTAVEAAILLHDVTQRRFQEIERIEIETQEAAMRIISKQGPLHNPADRDHCLEYMTAVALIHGDLQAQYYEDEFAQDPRIDLLRQKMHVRENTQFSNDYMNPDKRSIANSIQLFFSDGSCSEKIEVHYPIGHRRRRAEGIPLLKRKFQQAVSQHYNNSEAQHIISQFLNQEKVRQMSISDFIQLLVK